MINKLVETYNVQYSFSSTNKSALWILGGLMAALVTTGVIIQKKSKNGLRIGSKKQSLSTPKPLPEITLDDVGGLQSEIKQEILQTLTTLKEPERSAKIGIKPPQGILLYGPLERGKRCLHRQLQKSLVQTSSQRAVQPSTKCLLESVQPVSAAFSKMHVSNRQLSFSSMK